MTDQSSAAAFFEAIRSGNDAAVDSAVGANPALLDARDKTGLSPVIAAATSGHTKMACRLADLEALSADGLDVFDAAATGNVTAVANLLSGGQASVDDPGPDGYTALHFAAYLGQLEVARLLLGRGADPNAVAMNGSRVTPLHSAVAARHRDIAGLLLALGGSPNAVQHGGVTPLHSAASNGDEAIVDMLLLRGADATRAGDNGKTPIDLAEENGHGALAGVLRKSASNR
jgi:ankyrin repeat protein